MRLRLLLPLAAAALLMAGCRAAPAAEPTAAPTSPGSSPAPVTVAAAEVHAIEPDVMLGGDNSGAADVAATETAANAAAEAVAAAIVAHRSGQDPIASLHVDESIPADELGALFDALEDDAVEVAATATATEHGPVIEVTAGVLEFLFSADDDGAVLIAAGVEG